MRTHGLNNFCLPILMTVLAAGFSSCRTARNTVQALSQPDKSIVVLFENDVHCAMDGYARMAGLRDAVSDTAWVQLTSSGDYISGGTTGAISKGNYVIDVMQHMGYNAITFGNHEFDFRSPVLFELMKRMGDVATCANFVRKSDGQSLFADYVIRQVGNKKIAYIGVVTPTVLNTMPTAFTDKEGEQIYDLVPDLTFGLVQQAADKARQEGADYVIVLSHLGGNRADSYMTSTNLINATRGIDALLDGHSHDVVPMQMVRNIDGKEIPVAQTGTLFANVGHLLITPDGRISTRLIPMSEIQHENAHVKAVVDSINGEVLKITQRVIGRSDINLLLKDEANGINSRYCETNVANLVTDAFRTVCDADITILNAGSIRNSLKAGELTYGDLISLLPYDNMICTAEVTGAQVLEALNRNIVTLPGADGQFPVVSGLKYKVNVAEHAVTYVVVLDKATGEYKPLDPNATYTIATTDYALLNGGLRNAFAEAKILQQGIMNYCDCFVEYFTNHLNGHIAKEQYGGTEGRIILE